MYQNDEDAEHLCSTQEMLVIVINVSIKHPDMLLKKIYNVTNEVQDECVKQNSYR